MEGFKDHVTSLCLIAICFAAICDGTMYPVTNLYIENGQFYNGNYERVLIRGTNLRDANYCAYPGSPGIFEGFLNSTSVEAMLNWNINTVRLPLNQFCWYDMLDVGFGGTRYQQALQNYVALLEEYGMGAILTLAVSGGSGQGGGTPGTPTEVLYMPDLETSINFWSDVSFTFQNYTNVIFDIYDQPYPDDGVFNSSEAWAIWKTGDSSTQGMQQLLQAIRLNTQETIVLMTGIEYGNGMSEWLNNLPRDTSHRTTAIFHAVNPNPHMAGSDCLSPTQCWARDILPIIKTTPVVWVVFDYSLTSPTTYEADHGHGCESEVTGLGPNFAIISQDQHMVVGWWDATTTCEYGSIITDWGGTPSPGYGTVYQSIIAMEEGEGEY